MAYTKPKLSDLKQGLADRKSNGKLPTDAATLSLWIRKFNEAVEYCITKLRIEKPASLTTSGGTIALPDDFIFVNRVVDSGGNKLTKISVEDSALATGSYYWITGDFVSGFYLNTPEDKTYTVYYTYRTAPMTTDTDVCPFPDKEAIVAYAYGIIRRGESDPFEDAGISLAECDNRLKEIESHYLLNDAEQVLKLQNNA
jgi:hypothetical protein